MLEADVNARGGLLGPDGKRHPVRIVIYDDASDETRAVLASSISSSTFAQADMASGQSNRTRAALLWMR